MNPDSTLVTFFDTETGGIPNKKFPISKSDQQPYIVQLAFQLVEDMGNGRVIQSYAMPINTLGTISTIASAVNGWTTEKLQKYGRPIEEALELFRIAAELSHSIVAHNIEFDADVLDCESYRHFGSSFFNGNNGSTIHEPLTPFNSFCTMKAATDVCKIPPTSRMIASGRGNLYKAPSLNEAHQMICGRPNMDAHDAMGDVIGCRNVYLDLWRRMAKQ